MEDLRRLSETAFTDLSDEERELVSGAATGADVDFADGAQIRPELIRWLCTNPTAKSLVDTRGIRVTNAMVTGALDLRNISVEFYLRLHRCQIDGDINLNDAQVRSIGFSGSGCRQFLAWRARIGGQLFLTREGDDYFRASTVVLNDAVVTGNINLEGANIGPPQNREPALAADRATVSGILFAAGACIRGTTAAYDAEFGGIDARGVHFTADNASRTGCAVEIVRTAIKGNATFGVSDGPITRVNGTFALTNSHIGGVVSFADVQLSAAPQPTTAASGTGSDVVVPADDLLTHDIWPTLLNLAWTSVGGNLELRRTLIEEGSVDLSHVDVKLNAILTQHQYQGEEESTGRPQLLLTSASVGKVFHWQPFLPPDAIVDLSRATVDVLVLGGITYWPSEGQLWLGQLRYRIVNGPTLYKREWLAGPSRKLRARERKAHRLSGPLRFLLWIADVFAGADATGLRWLRLSTRNAYNSQPYDALAGALRASGLPAEATRVLIASADDRRRAKGPLSVLAGLPYRLLVANGFRTWLAVVWLAAFVLVDTVVFTAANHAGHLSAVKPGSEHLPFQPFVYSLDLLLPIVDLGQADAFLPIDPSSGWLRAFWWLQICLGWALATAIAASAASALQRSQT